MVKIAMISDLHFDVNHLDAKKLLQSIIDFLEQREVDYLFVAGDVFNEFFQTVDFFTEFNAKSNLTSAYFVAGNHEMVRNVKFFELEEPQSEFYLHNKSLSLPGINMTVVGNNGWYDYSFAKTRLDLTDNDYYHFKQTFWVDGVIDSPLSDNERFELSLKQIENTIQNVPRKQDVLLLTHFVPRLEFIPFNSFEKWNISTAMLGGIRLGELVDELGVKYVNFGHLHIRTSVDQINHASYIKQPLGYNTKRRSEWEQSDFMIEFERTLEIIEIN